MNLPLQERIRAGLVTSRSTEAMDRDDLMDPTTISFPVHDHSKPANSPEHPGAAGCDCTGASQKKRPNSGKKFKCDMQCVTATTYDAVGEASRSKVRPRPWRPQNASEPRRGVTGRDLLQGLARRPFSASTWAESGVSRDERGSTTDARFFFGQGKPGARTPNGQIGAPPSKPRAPPRRGKTAAAAGSLIPPPVSEITRKPNSSSCSP